MKNAIGIFIFAVIVLSIFLPSYSRMQDMQQKNLEYKRQIEMLKKKNAELAEENLMLEEDPEYLERVGREKMGLIKEGEVVYKIVPVEAE